MAKGVPMKIPTVQLSPGANTKLPVLTRANIGGGRLDSVLTQRARVVRFVPREGCLEIVVVKRKGISHTPDIKLICHLQSFAMFDGI